MDDDITDDLSDREFLDLLERDNEPIEKRRNLNIVLKNNMRYLRSGVMYQSLDDMLEDVFKQQTRI